MSASERELIVGGQAVIEGVMMRTPGAYAVAVRRADGTITHTSARLPKWSDKYPTLKLPVLRGTATLVQSMALGIKALNFSASAAYVEETARAAEPIAALKPALVEGEANFPTLTGGVPGLMPSAKRQAKPRTGSTASATGSIVFAVCFNLLLFVVAPLLLTNALFLAAGWAVPAGQAAVSETQSVTRRSEVERAVTPDGAASTGTNGSAATSAAPWYTRAYQYVAHYLRPVGPSAAFNLVDGAIRMTFFLLMIFSFSLVKDIRRVFEYHGAEHKTVFAWEAGLPLTVESARTQPRQHPRCGTSFLVVVMLVSVVLFSLVKFDSLAYNLLARVALVPVVAGLSYEVIRASAKREGSLIFKLMTLPGLWLQNVTTKEPDDRQLEVALHALRESLRLEPAGQALAADV